VTRSRRKDLSLQSRHSAQVVHMSARRRRTAPGGESLPRMLASTTRRATDKSMPSTFRRRAPPEYAATSLTPLRRRAWRCGRGQAPYTPRTPCRVTKLNHNPVLRRSPAPHTYRPLITACIGDGAADPVFADGEGRHGHLAGVRGEEEERRWRARRGAACCCCWTSVGARAACV